jgi:hypothetical protein
MVRPGFPLGCTFLTSFFGQKTLREVSKVFLLGLFKWPRWELGNPSQFASFCTQAAAMTSPKSVEMNLGAKEPLAEEAK